MTIRFLTYLLVFTLQLHVLHIKFSWNIKKLQKYKYSLKFVKIEKEMLKASNNNNEENTCPYRTKCSYIKHKYLTCG